MARLNKYKWLGLFLPVFAVFVLAVSEIHSFDLFWQLQSGKFIWQTKEFLYKDTFSLADQVFRYEHCWLHDLIVYLVYRIGDYSALSLLKGILLSATFSVLTLAARQRGASLISIVLVAFPAFLMTAWAWLARPQLWTFLFFAIFIVILDRHLRVADRLIFVLLPLLVLWANLHAAVILAFPLMAAFLVGALADQFLLRKSQVTGVLKHLVLVAVLMVPAACVTPYGAHTLRALIQAPKFGAETGGFAQKFNVDWQMTTYFDFPWFYYLIVFICLLFLLRWRSVRAADLLLLAGLALMGLKLARHTPFLFMGTAAIMPVYIDSLFDYCKKRQSFVHSAIRFLTILLLVSLVGQVAWSTYQRQGILQSGLREWYYPLAAVDFVKKHQLPGNLYNSYDWGGYLMWQLYPDYKVFWDGRQDSVEMYRIGRQIGNGEDGWQQLLDEFEVSTLIIKPLDVAAGARYRILDQLRKSHVWRLVFSDQNSLVFVRYGTMPDEWVKRYEQPKGNIDQTLLALGALLAGEHGTNRYQVYWEAFRIFFARGDYLAARQNLQLLKQRAPEEIRQAKIVRHYDALLEERLTE